MVSAGLVEVSLEKSSNILDAAAQAAKKEKK